MQRKYLQVNPVVRSRYGKGRTQSTIADMLPSEKESNQAVSRAALA